MRPLFVAVGFCQSRRRAIDRGPAAIDQERRASNVARRIGGEKRDRRGHLVRPRPISVLGTLMPIALAVFRLIASSNLVGRWPDHIFLYFAIDGRGPKGSVGVFSSILAACRHVSNST